MRFLYKILLWTIIIMAAAFGVSGYFFVNFVFQTALEREVDQALDGSNILRFAFETAALNAPTKYGVLQDVAIEQIGAKLEVGGQGSGRLLRLSDEDKKALYVSEGFTEDMALLQTITENSRSFQVTPVGERYYIQTGIMVSVLNRYLYLETMEDVTEVFEERAMGFKLYRQVTVVMLGVSAVVAGTGFLFSREIMLKNNGWPFHSLSEDTEFTVHSILAGEKIGCCGEAELFDEQPTSFVQSWHQRLRWVRGNIQVLCRYGAPLAAGEFVKMGLASMQQLLAVTQ